MAFLRRTSNNSIIRNIDKQELKFQELIKVGSFSYKNLLESDVIPIAQRGREPKPTALKLLEGNLLFNNMIILLSSGIKNNRIVPYS